MMRRQDRWGLALAALTVGLLVIVVVGALALGLGGLF